MSISRHTQFSLDAPNWIHVGDMTEGLLSQFWEHVIDFVLFRSRYRLLYELVPYFQKKLRFGPSFMEDI